MEEIKPRGRPRKPRAGILSVDQVAALQTPQQIAERERKDQDAARKREERARERAQREFGSIETMEALWAHNRTSLSEDELNDLLVKDQRTHDLWNWIELVLEGSDISRDPDWPSMESGTAAVENHVRKNGLCNPEVALIGQYWKLPLYENLKGGTGTFAKHGLFICLPEIRVRHLREMLAAQQPVKAQPGNGYSPLTCTSCSLLTGVVSVPDSIRDRYIELKIPFRCQRCRDLERTSRAQSTLCTGVPDEESMRV